MENEEITPIEQPTNGHAPAYVLSEQDRAQIRETERAQFLAAIENERAALRLEMQRELARHKREGTLTSWAQDATSPRIDRPKALPIEPQVLTAFTLALDAASPDLCTQFQGIVGRILTADLIDFSEHGSEGGADERDARQQYQELVAEKVRAGSSRVDAIKSVNREHPELYDAQRTLKGGK